jgi:hypothetical protein
LTTLPCLKPSGKNDYKPSTSSAKDPREPNRHH